MRTLTERDYSTYPRRFEGYKWYKPLLVGIIYSVLIAVFSLFLIDPITKALFGATSVSTGYDDMDFFSAAGTFSNGMTAAIVVPFMIIAALIVRDRPISSYFSSKIICKSLRLLRCRALSTLLGDFPVASQISAQVIPSMYIVMTLNSKSESTLLIF